MRLSVRVVLAIVPFFAAASPNAQEAPAPDLIDAEELDAGWSVASELTYVHAEGNAQTSTLGLGLEAIKKMESARLSFNAGALRAESTEVTRRAVGVSPDDFVLEETSDSDLTAESAFLRSRYDRRVRDDLFWYTGIGWERNEFAGFENRYLAVAGLGNIWLDGESARWQTDYGLTYTRQDDLVDNPALDDGFLGVRLTSDSWRRLTSSTEYTSLLIVDVNADETEDYRADFVNSLAVAVSERLALRVSLQLLYDHLPALTQVDLFLPDGTPAGEPVTVPLDDLDTRFSTALVVTF